MLSYFIKRILLFIPSIILIGAFTFALFHAIPNDPVAELLSTDGVEKVNVTEQQFLKQYKSLAKDLKLDRPKFYFSLVPRFYPDTLYKLSTKFERKRAVELLAYHNDWNTVCEFLNKGNKLKQGVPEDFKDQLDKLLIQLPPNEIGSYVQLIKDGDFEISTDNFLALATTLGQKNKKLFSVPKFLWFGIDNQFHTWMANFFSGRFGRSIIDGRPVWTKISKAMLWTLFMVIVGLFITLVISIPLGVWSAYNSDSKWDKVLSNTFYFIYAMPLFWFATLMVVFFTTAQYGWWTNIFPGVGISPFAGDGTTMGKILSNSKQLILPIFCLVLHSVAYLSRIVRSSIVAESNQQYKVSAMLKGLTKKATYWKHLFPNSLLPLVTIIIGVIPASLAGSLVLEVIFNIPGIGRLMFDSILANDWYVIFSIVMVVGMVTIVSYLIGDIIYTYVNPRIRFGKSSMRS